jgi:hypothetical protein
MHYVLLFLFMVVIVGAGWNEPLKYRFMSADKILALEQERATAFAPAQPREKSGAWMWDRDYRTALERNTIVGMPQVEIREPNITTRWIKSDAGEER